MRCQRWLIVKAEPTGLPVGLDGKAVSFAVVHHFEDGDALVKADFMEHELREVQADPRVTVLPSLTADAKHAHQRFHDKLKAKGVALEQGDVMLHALRKLRDANGAAFDINLPF
jgi:hypothetical protein